MGVKVTPEEAAVFRRHARAREATRLALLATRKERARTIALRAAQVLKSPPWNATRVLLYGSLARGHHFHERSDIDLAAAGISPEYFFYAWAALAPIEEDFEVNLAPLESVSPKLRTVIEQEGVEL